ncbi:MAG: hypothetical protein J2P26_01405 [Nocardiopsaceae bacterium]|nr:hypothetical protein [Nocardiopsaceae bacterium]
MASSRALAKSRGRDVRVPVPAPEPEPVPELVRTSRQPPEAAAALTPASAAVTLTWKSSGPPPAWPCGASSAVSLTPAGSGTVCAVSTRSSRTSPRRRSDRITVGSLRLAWVPLPGVKSLAGPRSGL